jgi:rhodanese-related sulfurtransferase
VDLSRKTGASIVFGPGAEPAFPAVNAADGQVFTLGSLTIKVLHTPGHTMESCCYLLNDSDGKPCGLFTGDTLFIGDVGRTDLAQKAAHMTTEELAGLLYESLLAKVMPLPDDVVVYPGHGAGSAGGRKMSNDITDTLGHQKKVNYALRDNLTKQQFIKEVTTGLMPPPGYFPVKVILNKKGYESIDIVLERGRQALSPAAFEAAANETGALVLDTRSPQVFAHGFIPNSVNIGLDGGFAPWVGTLITDIKQPILLIVDEGREEETVTRLARVGYDNAIGYLKGGFEAWERSHKDVEHIHCVTPWQLANIAQHHALNLLDVRKKNEYESEHIQFAENMPLDYISDEIVQLDKDKTFYVYCGSGYRSVIFISILMARGFTNLINITGGFKAMKESGRFTVTDFVCPVSLL